MKEKKTILNWTELNRTELNVLSQDTRNPTNQWLPEAILYVSHIECDEVETGSVAHKKRRKKKMNHSGTYPLNAK